MALTLTLYKVNKRQNSTAVPSGTGSAVQVTLKQETSLNSPTFLLSGQKPDANYAQFDGAYYFIDDIVSVRANLWEIICSLDVLATFAAEIRATSAFVEYAAQGFDDISDSRIVPRTSVTLGRTILGGGNVLGISETGTFLLSAVGESGVNTYVVNAQQLRNMLLSIGQFADGLWSSAMSPGEALVEYFRLAIAAGSAADAITDCRWLPFVDNGFDVTGFTSIKLGRYDTGIQAGILAGTIQKGVISGTIPFTRSGFLRLRPYSEVMIYLPFVGMQVIDTPLFTGADTVGVNYSLNERTGEISYAVAVDDQIILTLSASTAGAVPIGISNINPMQIINGLSSAALATAYGNVVGAAGSVLNALTPTQVSSGGISGGAGSGLEKQFIVYLVERAVSGAVGNMAASQGKPYFNTALLGSLSGFVKTRGASVSGTMRGALRDQINTLLDSGIFLE